MTHQTIANDNGDGFWTRVRSALGMVRPDRERVPAYGQAAIARSVGLKPKLGSRIEEELNTGWAIASARNVSISLLVVEIDRVSEYYNAYGRAALDEAVYRVMQTVTDKLPRAGDTCLRLGRASFVVVLSDMPVLVARKTAAEIDKAVRALNLAHKESHAGVVTVSAGIAVCNPDGGYDRKFFETAAEAVKKAQRRGLARLEVVDLRPAQERRRKAA